MKATLLTVSLASNEWGNDLMRDVALTLLQCTRPPTGHVLLVEVREHGGWYLRYAMITGRLEVIGTANDMAEFPAHVREWKKAIASVEYGDWIRRDDLPSMPVPALRLAV